MKSRSASSTLKKVVVQSIEGGTIRGYLNPTGLGRGESLDLLLPNGSHETLDLQDIKSVYFVREFTDDFEPQRKVFFSRPKLEGLWVRLKFRDNDMIEGIVPNNLLELLDRGVQITPPDLHGESARMFIPRSALAEMSVLGVVGVARRASKRVLIEEAAKQAKLFGE